MTTHTGATSRSPLVGRADEIKHLETCWQDAREARGKVVVISGEAGIGKSRLGVELERKVRASDVLTMRFHCSAMQSNDDLHPLHEYLIRYAGARRNEPDHVRHGKILQMLDFLDNEQMPVRLLSSLVAIGGVQNPLQMLQSPRRRRNELLSALLDGLADLASLKPLLLILEDAQWLDPTSNTLLKQLAERAPGQRLLIVVTARREYDLSWIGAAHTSVLVPRRLSHNDIQTLATRIVAAERCSPAALKQIVERSEGVPLFVEELSKAVASTAPGELKIPDSLQSLLMTRLDKVGPAKRMAQVAAVLGRQFSHDIGVLLWGGSEAEFAQVIADLMAADVLQRKPIERGAQYSFRHTLLQEAAYGSLLRQQRTAIHADIVRALASNAKDVVADQPALMAHHSDFAEDHLAAAGHWLMAGKASVARGAVEEAVTYFRHGLASVRRNSVTDQRERLEFELNSNLGPALMALEGYTSEEGLMAFSRASKLLSWSRSSLEESHVLLGLFNVHFGRAEFAQALDVGIQADRLLAMGFGGYPVLMGQALCMMGELTEAQRCLERAIAQYDATLDMNSGLFCRADVVATSFLAKVEFAFGNLDRARALTDAAMSLAQQQGHPIAIAIGYLGQLFLAAEAGDLGAAVTLADNAHSHAVQHHLGNYRLWVSFHRAALSLRTNPTAAIAAMHGLIDEGDAVGTLTFRPAQLGLLGGAYASLGRTDEALVLIDKALQLAHTSRGLEAMPALRRLRGKMLALIRPDRALRDVEASLAMARGQSARMEMLRSATVLARMLKDTDRRDDGRDLLAGIYQSFTQGHQYPDLQQAARVLEQLSGMPGPTRR